VGFRSNRSPTDQIFCICQILVKKWKSNGTLVCEHNLFRKRACNPKHSYIKANFPIRNNGNSDVIPKLKHIHIKIINTKYIHTFLCFYYSNLIYIK
jgi:hypothetical protein